MRFLHKYFTKDENKRLFEYMSLIVCRVAILFCNVLMQYPREIIAYTLRRSNQSVTGFTAIHHANVVARMMSVCPSVTFRYYFTSLFYAPLRPMFVHRKQLYCGRLAVLLTNWSFCSLPRDATQSAALLWQSRLSVCPSVRL